jgi:hypothetical protein
VVYHKPSILGTIPPFSTFSAVAFDTNPNLDATVQDPGDTAINLPIWDKLYSPFMDIYGNIDQSCGLLYGCLMLSLLMVHGQTGFIFNIGFHPLLNHGCWGCFYQYELYTSSGNLT